MTPPATPPRARPLLRRAAAARHVSPHGHSHLRKASRPAALALAIAIALAAASCAPPRSSDPLAQSAYVWQRTWSPAVSAAVRAHAPAFARLVVLAAEVRAGDGALHTQPIAYDAAALRDTHASIGLAVRCADDLRPLVGDTSAARQLADACAELVRAARARGIEPAELQLDFDCPESRLAGYRAWLAAVRVRIAPVPLTLTALPAWLRRREFAALARASDGFVLQVHGLPRGVRFGALPPLCDPVRARRDVETAARVGVPFRVALPTYAHRLAFGPDGAVLPWSAEGERVDWPAGTRLREVSAEPAPLAALVAQWTRSRPRALAGVLWYRLPVEGESFNWSWPTLAAVMAGNAPHAALHGEATHPQPGLVEVVLRNDGDADAALPASLALRARGARVIAADALGGWRLAPPADGAPVFLPPAAAGILAPGRRLVVGWVRFDRDTEVSVEIRP